MIMCYCYVTCMSKINIFIHKTLLYWIETLTDPSNSSFTMLQKFVYSDLL